GPHGALVDRDADGTGADRGVGADERPPERPRRGPGIHGTILTGTQALTQRGEEAHPHARHAQPLTSCRMWLSTGRSSFCMASSTAFVEPGSDTITVRAATPATAPDTIAAAPLSSHAL